ncbi:MAG: hypothetical protein QN157_00395 [Armatimonadota bacterium]|nr:hypothetical protein [Armatimonadota bacterium]
MSKPVEKQKAIDLRRAGCSYREILQQVPVAKATLSAWLRSVGLSRTQAQRLTAKRLAAGRRGAEKLRQARVARVATMLRDAEAEACCMLTAGEWFWVLGTALYWAEGFKPKPWRPGRKVGFSNMDPDMIRIVRAWLQRYCGVQEDDLVYLLQIHPTADLPRALAFWAAQLGVPQGQIRVSLKRPNPSPRRRNTGTGYYGTMQMRVRRSTALNHRIAGWTRGLVRCCGVV